MPLNNGTKNGSAQQFVNCAGISVARTLNFSGTSSPSFGVTVPAALSGTMGSSGALTLAASTTFAGTEKVAVFWTVAGVNYYRYDCAITSGTGTSFTVSSGSGTALPTGGQAVLVAVNVDLGAAQSVSILGDDVQQLLATSNQIGLIEWLSATPAQQRLSYITQANDFDTWPTLAGQAAPPSGGAGSNWSSATTVVTLRFWNFSTSPALMQVGAMAA